MKAIIVTEFGGPDTMKYTVPFWKLQRRGSHI
jgi:hypothetical protein